MKGFKTFADKEELVFDSQTGITAVVGPNGCGKSNIVDAFRFALGEGNIRELRVHALPEVVFAGTDSRKPLSLAEVSLSFDNSNHALPIDYSEVSIKRRTFRDGESEFSINSQICRLKDIRDLFLDSGLSTQSISIMSQGNVDAVLSSKPEDRRAIFEEVAGISKYKTRKVEAEKKLIMSEQNLLRISDLKVEISEQLISLESQAKTASEYKGIQEQLKSLELATFKKQAKQLLERKGQVSSELEKIKRSNQEKEDQRKKIFEEKALLAQQLREIERLIDQTLLETDRAKDQIEEERGNLVLEKERYLYSEKGKLRDIKEEERFLVYEIGKISEDIRLLELKKTDLIEKSKDLAKGSLSEFGDFKETIRLTIDISQKLKEILRSAFGKTHEYLNSSSQAEQFNKLLNIEKSHIDEEMEARKKENIFKAKKLEELKGAIKLAEASLKELELATEEFIKTPMGQIAAELVEKRNNGLKKLEELRLSREQASLKLEELEKASYGGAVSNDGTSDLIKQEIFLAKIDSELAQIESHIRVEYGLTYDELLQFQDESPNVSKSKKEIESLKYRLRELEPVNLLAIDEFEKCKERNSFVESQHQDIVLARENLKTLITELDLKAREDFIKSMEALAANFSQVFSELFEGGEAKIEIEKDKDALDAGIEISVRPRNRKWLHLSLLSGGERSLTAIALLFAILKTSPSPICILDEVDAALDDANVGRFAGYLKKYAEASQIIVITHNKRTMAVADTIYGITMEEPGVSRVLSMKLEKAA